MLPDITEAERLQRSSRRVLIASYGFEDRSLGWTIHQKDQGTVLNDALMFRYKNPKGRNRISELKNHLSNLGVSKPIEIEYDAHLPRNIEDLIQERLEGLLVDTEELVVDISAMTKLLILICLCKLKNFNGTLRLVYSEAFSYGPTEQEYDKSKDRMGVIAKFPSRGFESIVRAKCLSSVRMQGQPVTMIAFTSFNEQLVRHMLGTISPHRLLFVNGRPPLEENRWRELATQEIHKKLIEEYSSDNSLDSRGLLTRVASTLQYSETYERIEEIYDAYGKHERIICAATGSKMQTVGLFLSKIKHPDIHIEYPIPDSYYVKGMTRRVRKVHEILFPCYSDFLMEIEKRLVSETVLV